MSAQSAGATAPAPVSRGVKDAPSFSHVIHELWERADDRLSASELEWFAGILTHAEFISGKLGGVLENIGCRVLENGKTDGTYGAFQTPSEFFALMCVTTEMIDHIRALIEIGDSATHRLLNPGLYPKPGEGDPGGQA
jgi:hypothetical protein